MEPETFEVMLLATVPGGGIRQGQWFTESSHDGLEAAQWRLREIAQDLPDPRLVVVVVSSRFDNGAGRYRERIVASRAEGSVPALAASLALPASAWPELRRGFRRALPPPPAGLAPRARVRPKQAPRRRLVPGLMLLGAAGAGAALLLL
jgi:hypothetical protein